MYFCYRIPSLKYLKGISKINHNYFQISEMLEINKINKYLKLNAFSKCTKLFLFFFKQLACVFCQFSNHINM